MLTQIHGASHKKELAATLAADQVENMDLDDLITCATNGIKNDFLEMSDADFLEEYNMYYGDDSET